METGWLRSGSLGGAAGAALGSAAASICCVGPIGITLLGVQGAIFAAGLKPWRYWLLAGSLGLIGVAFLLARRPLAAEGAHCPTRIGRWTRRVLRASLVVWTAALLLNIANDLLWI